ncbi:hypothetical protein [Dechloromonas sp. CZR5]|uniref:hypothetical protein n=1 Tax=Dechloromonas sp. CZR5 TaxID=2608630 RepID=UPI00123D093F|nr:hypothetical protein [Dechloromonas sp. CZR5]
MAEWIVQDRKTGKVVHVYPADDATDFEQFPFSRYNHIPHKPEDAPAPQREITGVSYLRRFSQEERIAIRDAAKTSSVLDDYLKLLDATIAQGGVINLDDPDTVAAVNLLEQSGLLAPGRAAEVLA